MKPVRRSMSAALVAGCVMAVMVGCGTYESGGAPESHSEGGAGGEAGGEEATPAAEESTESLLMVLESRSGRLAASGGDGEYTLTLRRPSQFVTVFTDRPQRRAWRIDTDRFVDFWGEYGFEDDPPNAALEAADAPPGRDLMILELSDPELTSGRLTFTARQGSEQDVGGAAFERPAAELDAATLRRPTLFIDSGTTPSPDGWTAACTMEKGQSSIQSTTWHCTWGSVRTKPQAAGSVVAQKCPGSFTDQGRDLLCII